MRGPGDPDVGIEWPTFRLHAGLKRRRYASGRLLSQLFICTRAERGISEVTGLGGIRESGSYIAVESF
jgi:hypothetical protein